MTDDRAVSTVLNYILTLAIASLLIVGLIVATSGFADRQREQTIRDELHVLGQQLASDLAAADRLVVAGGTTVRIRRDLPTTAAGARYRIEVDTSPPGSLTTLRLSTDDPEVVVDVDVRTETDVGGGTLAGGSVLIRYTGTELVIEDA